MKYFFLMAAALFALSGTADAQEQNSGVPAALQGIWAMGSCDNPTVVSVYSANFVADLVEKSYSVYRLVKIEQADYGVAARVWRQGRRDYMSIGLDGADRMLRADSIKSYHLINLPDDARPENPFTIAYARCAAMPGNMAMNDADMQAFKTLDRIDITCRATPDFREDTACLKSIFDVIDRDGSGGLAQDEIAFFRAGAMSLLKAQKCGQKEETAAEQMSFSDSVLRLVDADGSGAASFEELRSRQNLFAAVPEIALFGEQIGLLDGLFPWLAVPGDKGKAEPAAQKE